MSSKRDYITLNVGGQIFKTTRNTLTGSEYLSTLTKWETSTDEIFIDRSPELFKHVIGVLRNPEYPYPEEHLSELDFYLMDQPNNIVRNTSKLEYCHKFIKTKFNLCNEDLCTNEKHPGFDYCEKCRPLRVDPGPLNINDIVRTPYGYISKVIGIEHTYHVRYITEVLLGEDKGKRFAYNPSVLKKLTQ